MAVFLLIGFIVICIISMAKSHENEKKKKQFRIGDKLYFIGSTKNVHIDHIFEVVEISNKRYTIKCVEGKDINGKEMEYCQTLEEYSATELFMRIDRFQELFKYPTKLSENRFDISEMYDRYKAATGYPPK